MSDGNFAHFNSQFLSFANCVQYIMANIYCPQQKFACNGTVIDHPEYGEVIQVQGDQRNNIRQFIKDVSDFTLEEFNRCNSDFFCHTANLFFQVGLASDEQLKVHGF